MSSLPSILHQSGFKLMPVTLEVGDYVLSPNICVVGRCSLNPTVLTPLAFSAFQRLSALEAIM